MELDHYSPSVQQLAQLNLIIKLIMRADSEKIRVYVDGGYGLDALYGKLTRDHRDLDVYVHEKDVSKFEGILNEFGFCPSGNRIGEIGKKEYINKEFPDHFTIEYGVLEDGFKYIPGVDPNKYIPTEPIGVLDDCKIWIPTLEGFKLIIELNNKLAIKNKYPEYPHKEWMQTILNQLDKKFNNSNS